MSGCTYTTQGTIVCFKPSSNLSAQPKGYPPLGSQALITKFGVTEHGAKHGVEGFVNTRPNQNDSMCGSIAKKLNDVMSPYNCSTRIENKSPKCTFQFDCEEPSNT